MLSVALAAYLMVVGVLAIYGLHRAWLTIGYWRRRNAPARTSRLPDELPVVTVQLPLFNERYVAGRLIDAVAALDWPRDKLEIQILDDSTDATTALCRERCAALVARGFDIVQLHRTERTGFKAGALAAGSSVARGDLMLVLDADFVPPADLLRRTVGYFHDPGLGMVQVRWEHLNRDYSMLTRVQALLLDGHFVVEQTVRSRSQKFFNFNGTAGIWRRAAIEEAGGWQHDTLTEDLDLSYRALLAGWRFEYLVGMAAPAELPVDMNAFKSQQFRWAKGSMQVARKLLPEVLRRDLPVRVKLEACFHLTQNLPYFLTLLLVILVVPVLVVRQWQYQPWLDLPLLFGTTGVLLTYCLTSQGALRRVGWHTLIEVPALVAVTVGISISQTRAVIEGLLGIRSDFVRTPKQGVIRCRPRASVGPLYRGLRDATPVVELLLAAYLLCGLLYGVQLGRWTALPILAVFASGFAYVGTHSLLRR
jgi:cellulose synthase/poly-beta-1,6-N-acetylglucosamine synthase-like glycosyltransferase